jgi:hypothetical protein
MFVIDGGGVIAFASVADAEDGTELHDIEECQYFGVDGRIFKAAADRYRVRLTPTTERRPDDLQARLDAYPRHPRLEMYPALAGEPRRLATVLIDRQRREVWPRRLASRYRKVRNSGRRRVSE